MQQKDIYAELVEEYVKVEKRLKKYKKMKKEFPEIYTLAIAELHAQEFFITYLLVTFGKSRMIPVD